jgi:hypothetical protein
MGGAWRTWPKIDPDRTPEGQDRAENRLARPYFGRVEGRGRWTADLGVGPWSDRTDPRSLSGQLDSARSPRRPNLDTTDARPATAWELGRHYFEYHLLASLSLSRFAIAYHPATPFYH